MAKKNKTVEIRRELKALIQERFKACTTQKEKNAAVNLARAEINRKYGKDWRQAGVRYDDTPSIYDGHENGEHWM